VITRKGGKVVTIPLVPRTAARSIWPSTSVARGRPSWLRMGGGWTGAAPRGSFAAPPAPTFLRPAPALTFWRLV
jgi:hypothetical protein